MISYLEICANGLDSAIIADRSGAHRIELCANLMNGGTTPSYATVALAKKHVTIPIHILIRPRAGDFLYTEHEYDVIKQDILQCKSLRCDGVVIGCLLADGQIDVIRTQALVQLAAPMSVTFHRAFDACHHPLRALNQLIDSGCQRILTSGLKNTALEGCNLLRTLILKADRRIAIMPGSGINSSNIQQLIKQTGALEYHTSAKKIKASGMHFKNSQLANMDEKLTISDGEEIKLLLEKMK